jgi:hypothetical protein
VPAVAALVNRRAIAPLIRARQELWKRVERLGSPRRWRGGDDTLAVLDLRDTGLTAGGAAPSLSSVAQVLRRRAASRFPTRHLVGRDARALVDRDAVIADADRIRRGEWDALGAPVRVNGTTVDWRTHPVSLVSTPALHFSRVSYAADVLGGDVKYLWEVNRHAELVRLAQGYWLTRRPELAEAALALLDSWIAQNPPGIGINWISTVDVAFRVIAWCWTWALTADCDAWTDERVGRLVWMVEQCARFIDRYDSVHHSPNTHLTGEALGLVYVGTVFPELRHAERWRTLGVAILTEEVSHQFLDDGMHYERCTGYHRYHLEFYLHALVIARARQETWAEPFRAPVSRGVDASVQLRRPDGTWPVLGDEDGGAAVRLGTRDVADQNDLLVVAAGLLNRPELHDGPARDATAVAWWLLDDAAWNAVLSGTGGAQPAAAFSLGAAGYYGARDDWSDSAWYCVVDAGPHGGDATGHAHTDLGHVEIARGTHRLTVDPGCSMYNSAPARRNWFRSQRAHASLMIDDVELATPSSAFGWRRVAPTPVVESGDRRDYWWCRLTYPYPVPSGPVEHERQVVLIRSGGVVVCDFVRGNDSHTVVTRWPLGVSQPEARLTGDGLAMDGSRVRWFTRAGAPVVASVEATRRSPRFGAEVDACELVLTSTAVSLPWSSTVAFTSDQDALPRFDTVGEATRVTVSRGDSLAAVTVAFTPGAMPALGG